MTDRSGFTLLEICIVLTVIALIVGGVLTGRTLLRSAEIRSVLNEGNQYRSAVLLFKTQYHALPGDMRNATEFWGAADGGDGLGSDCTTIDSTSAVTTCNGNGNGQIELDAASPYIYERYRLWQHLANAGMAQGSFSGVTGPSSTRQSLPGINVPAATGDSGVGFSIFYMRTPQVPFFADWFHVPYGEHIMVIGKQTNNESRAPFLSTSEMRSIEDKQDDGLPASGLIRSWPPSTALPECTTSTDPATAQYAIGSEDAGNTCTFMIMLNF